MRVVENTLLFDDLSASDLVQRFGSPLYVYEAAVLRRQIENLRRAFAAMPLTPAYALKANSSLAILRMIADAGFGFDAVSPGELHFLKRIGVAGERIWFTCSNVSDDDLLAIGDDSILINVNGMSELDRVIRLQLRNPLALRVNPDVGAGHHRDVVTGGFGVKFGFDLAEVNDAMMLAGDAGSKVVGIHAHIGSGVTTVEPLLESARILIELVRRYEGVRVLNFGGGIATPYQPAEAEFPIDEYGRRLAELAGDFLRQRNMTAIVEPGRYLVAQCGTLLTTVTTKHISSGYEWIGCDTGFNHLQRPSKYGAYHHIINASRTDAARLRASHPVDDDATTIVAGNICESGDVFTRDDGGIRPRAVGDVRVGDLLAICDAGAYGFSMASEYNARTLPAEVLVDGSEVRLIRRRRELEDLLREQND